MSISSVFLIGFRREPAQIIADAICLPAGRGMSSRGGSVFWRTSKEPAGVLKVVRRGKLCEHNAADALRYAGGIEN